jgi:hypothetical protein
MKLLKIYFAVLFFSFLGSMQNQLSAQEPTKNIGSSAQKLSAGEYMENGQFRAKLSKGITSDDGSAMIVIYKTSDNSIVKKLSLHRNPLWEDFKFIGFDTSNPSEIWYVYSYKGSVHGPGDTRKMANLSEETNCVYGGMVKALSPWQTVTPSVHFHLTPDGRFVIISGTGGQPMAEFIEK